MSLNFPITPANGDRYEGFIYDSNAGVWNSDTAQIAARFVTSATAPASPIQGDGWFDTNTAKSYIYYDGYWVQIGAYGTVGLDQIDGLSIDTPSDGQVLSYDAANSEWVNETPASTLGSLTDTDIASPVIGQSLVYDGTSWVNRFLSHPVEYVVVAGGGGGGGGFGGGGGAGGYRSSVSGEFSGGGFLAENSLNLFMGSHAVTIGAGGSGSTGNYSSGSKGVNGGASSFANISATGGGGGGTHNQQNTGSNGGSGGGRSGTVGDAGSGAPDQGFDGGLGLNGTNPNFRGAGGGGAGQIGGNSGTGFSGGGGNGVESNITGTLTYLAGGGGGGSGTDNTGAGAGGNGGGGGGGNGTVGIAADANTGGGGGGGGNSINGDGTNSGGSGVVIFKITESAIVTFSAGVTQTNATANGFTVYTVTAAGPTDTVTIA